MLTDYQCLWTLISPPPKKKYWPNNVHRCLHFKLYKSPTCCMILIIYTVKFHYKDHLKLRPPSLKDHDHLFQYQNAFFYVYVCSLLRPLSISTNGGLIIRTSLYNKVMINQHHTTRLHIYNMDFSFCSLVCSVFCNSLLQCILLKCILSNTSMTTWFKQPLFGLHQSQRPL